MVAEREGTLAWQVSSVAHTGIILAVSCAATWGIHKLIDGFLVQ